MSLEAVTMWRVVCDGEGCTASAQDETEHYAWLDEATAEDDANYDGWAVRSPSLHLCSEHNRTVCMGKDQECNRRDVTEADDGWMYCPEHKAEGMDDDREQATP